MSKKEVTYIATKPLSNTIVVGIIALDVDNDCVKAEIKDILKPRWHKLYTNNKGTYFIMGKTRYYIDEFIRTDF